jgi:hypothetical protein
MLTIHSDISNLFSSNADVLMPIRYRHQILTQCVSCLQLLDELSQTYRISQLKDFPVVTAVRQIFMVFVFFELKSTTGCQAPCLGAVEPRLE